MAKKDFKKGLGSIIPDQGDTPIAKKTTKAKAKKAKPQSIKHSLTLDKEQLEKLRFISEEERNMLKTVIFEAFKDYIKKYEKKNGEIEV